MHSCWDRFQCACGTVFVIFVLDFFFQQLSCVGPAVALVSFPDRIFRAPPEKWVWSTAYSIFVQVGRNVSALFFSNLMFDVIKDCIPHCVRSTREMDVDRATLAAVYRLGFSIF